MAFTHYKIGARSGAIWTATQFAFKYLTLNKEDIILFTGTPNTQIHRTCEMAPYHYYSKAEEVPVGIQKMKIMCDYNAVDAIYEADTFLGTLVWNREYWQERIGYRHITTLTQMYARAIARLGLPNTEMLSSSRGVTVDMKKVGNIAEFIECPAPDIALGWAGTHIFTYLTIDHDLHDRMINKQNYGRCINIVGPWSLYFAGLKEFQKNLRPSDVASAIEAEVSELFNLPVQAGNLTTLLTSVPAELTTKVAARAFIESGGRREVLYDNA